MSHKKPITEFELLLIANQLIQDHECYIEACVPLKWKRKKAC